MLNGTLTLHNIPDVEQLCNRIIRTTRWTATLTPDQRASLLAYLLVETWRLSERFDPQRNDSFENYAGTLLRRRAIDWRRKEFGRTIWTNAYVSGDTYERQHPHVTSLDQLGRADTLRHSSDPTDRHPTLTRLHHDRARHRTQDLHHLDQRVPHRTAA